MTNDLKDIDELADRYRRIAAPAGLRARIMARVGERPPQRAFWQPALALGAAAVLIVVATLTVVQPPDSPAPIAQPNPALAPGPAETIAQAPITTSERVTASLAETAVLSAASAWLTRRDAAPVPDLGALPDVMSVQSIADIPDPFS